MFRFRSIIWFIVLLVLPGCQKTMVKPGQFQPIADERLKQNHLTNNFVFQNARFKIPLEESKRFQLSSAVDGNIHILGNILFVATQDAHIESFDLADLKKIKSRRFRPKIRTKIIPVDTRAILAKEYGKKTIFCMDLLSNHILWEAEPGSVKGEVKVYKEKVLVPGLYKGLYCYRLNDGMLLWQLNKNQQLLTGPAVYRDKAVQLFENGELVAISLESGRELWTRRTAPPGTIPPVVADSLIVCVSPGGTVQVFDLNGSQLWRLSLKKMIRRAPAILDSQLVVADHSGMIRAFNVRNGRVLWQTPVNALPGTAMVLTADYAITGTLSNTLLFLQRTDGRIVWELELLGKIRTAPIFYNKVMIAASEKNHLFIFGERR